MLLGCKRDQPLSRKIRRPVDYFSSARSDQFVARAATQRRIYRPEKSTTCSAKPGIVSSLSFGVRDPGSTVLAKYKSHCENSLSTSIFASRSEQPLPALAIPAFVRT